MEESTYQSLSQLSTFNFSWPRATRGIMTYEERRKRVYIEEEEEKKKKQNRTDGEK